jgi:hypothetical protein
MYVSIFFAVGERALYGGRQHNCQNLKPIVNTMVAGKGRSRSSMHNSGIVAIAQLVISPHLFINLEMLIPKIILNHPIIKIASIISMGPYLVAF